MTRTRTVITALSCLSVLALGACSDDDPEPKFAPTPSTSAPTQTSTSPSVDAREEQAAFIDGFFAEVTASISSGDSSSFLDLAPHCKNCRVIAQNLEDAYTHGGHIEGGNWTVKSASPTSKEESTPTWSLRLNTAEERWFDADDQIVKIVDPTTLRVSLLLEADGAGWNVREMKLL